MKISVVGIIEDMTGSAITLGLFILADHIIHGDWLFLQALMNAMAVLFR